jgi:hypothetical protein
MATVAKNRKGGKGGAYYFLSVVKSQKIPGFNNNFLICNR